VSDFENRLAPAVVLALNDLPPRATTTMSHHAKFPEPPTESSLQAARVVLDDRILSRENLSRKIADAELKLRQMVHEAECAIAEMREERVVLEDNIQKTRGYLSPIRRLPLEVLRLVFTISFEIHPCSAWILASVCRNWRHLALEMPRIWSRVRRTCHLLRAISEFN
jgi:hypothetical protein